MRNFTVTALLALILGGCASAPSIVRIEADSPPPSSWILQGRIAVQGGEQSLSGTIHWRHGAETDEVLMTSPLGLGVARIVRDAEGLMLEMPNQPLRRATDVESLTREALGYALPVSGLTWWVQARPDPGRTFEATRDVAGRLAQLKQDGWVIDYLDYVVDVPARPRKMVVARDGLEIRLVADDWQTE